MVDVPRPPLPRQPIIQPNGYASREFTQFIELLWRRTGGEIDAVADADATSMEGLYAQGSLQEIVTRLDALESAVQMDGRLLQLEQRLDAFEASVSDGRLSQLEQRLEALENDFRAPVSRGSLGFEKQSALTSQDAGAVNSGDATTDGVIENNRTRIAEIETRLENLELL